MVCSRACTCMHPLPTCVGRGSSIEIRLAIRLRSVFVKPIICNSAISFDEKLLILTAFSQRGRILLLSVACIKYWFVEIMGESVGVCISYWFNFGQFLENKEPSLKSGTKFKMRVGIGLTLGVGNLSLVANARTFAEGVVLTSVACITP